jgi:hypothetical protein
MDPCTNECCATKARMSTCYYTEPSLIPAACTVPSHNTSEYDEALSLRLLQLAAASYCNVTSLESWECKPCVDRSFRLHRVLQDVQLDLQVCANRPVDSASHFIQIFCDVSHTHQPCLRHMCGSLTILA